MDEISSFIIKYQALVVGGLGFAGVIYTIYYNAKNQLELQNEKIKHDVRTLRVAFKTELLANKDAYETRIEQFSKPKDNYKDALIKNKSINDIYKTLLSNIGQLSEKEVENIYDAYQVIGELQYRLRILAGTDSIAGYESEFITFNQVDLDYVNQLHELFLPSIVKAIDSINHELDQ
jgi:hypothetical protein